MPPTDPSDEEIIEAYESGALTSIASKTELNRLKAAARATAAKDRRVNIRLSEGDLQDIQVRALAEGMPYQTLIASILHKYVTGRLEEREIGAARATSRTKLATRRTTRGDG
jgi:predicted DNA binding CopG/RHH family protein